jgi:hypothetical protein
MSARLRTKHAPYTTVSNEVIRNEKISIEARGMLVMLLSFSDGWKFNAKHIMAKACVGRDKFQRIMAELKEAGHLKMVPVRGDDGRMQGHDWHVFSEPAECDDNRMQENPLFGKPGPIRKNNREEEKIEESPLPPKGDGDLFSAKSETESLGETVEDLFEEWWRIYPNREGANPKKSAAAKFKSALKKVSWPKLRAATERYARSRKGEDARFTPMAATWLNQERWEDFAPSKSVGDGPFTFDPKEPFRGIPETVAQAIRFDPDREGQIAACKAYWTRREAAE